MNYKSQMGQDRFVVEQLKGKKNVEFHFVAFDLKNLQEQDRRIEDLQVVGRLTNYTFKFQDTLTPVLT